MKNNPLALGFDFFKGVLTPDEGLGGFDKEIKKGKEPSRGPTEALEAGSAEALRFAARPVEKTMVEIANKQLGEQEKIVAGIEKIAASPNQVNTANI